MKRLPRWSKAFIAALKGGYSVTHACAKAQVERSTAYRFRERSADFAAAWDDAHAQGTDRLRDEALKRGVVGTERQVFDGDGRLIRRELNPSDYLLDREISRRMPREGVAIDVRVQVIDSFRTAMNRLNELPPERVPALLGGVGIDAARLIGAAAVTDAEMVPMTAPDPARRG